ncbi:hypothetical protein GFS24_07000 [Chitinophaga sp. SYP-B3965]|uniref:hypothetical protein n=1 Tax=Chitinophaga sp. SYP-B3965 TaxID=2663120 RepID=UPI0012998795|nr:hypothetical protein [Chitinophaga sp. SYP-B3965]MRG44854.1 hypothetical protein [Chitinophaga sp. SYP-B3965]
MKDIINSVKKQFIDFMRIIVMLSLLMFLHSEVKSQDENYPTIGKKFPNFTLTNFHDDLKDELSFGDLFGKYVIIDFWTIGCSSCIAGFPMLNLIQNKNSDKLKVILVGREEKIRDIRKYYDIYRKKSCLTLTSTYDSIFFNKVVPMSVPHYVWIDKNGLVKAITSSDDVTEQNIEKFISDLPFYFRDMSYANVKGNKRQADQSMPLLIDGNGGESTDYLFRSILMKPNYGQGWSLVPDIANFTSDGKVRYQAMAASLPALYMVAYFGAPFIISRYPKVWPWPIIITKDSLRFQYQSATADVYNYSIEAPLRKGTPADLMKMMQRDLENYFGYRTRIVQRDMPCLKLVVINKNKVRRILNNVGGPSSAWEPESRINRFNNIAIDNIPIILSYRLTHSKFVTINETGITGNVSFSVEADIDDLESIRASLRQSGLDLIPSTMKLDVLEISDSF